MPGRRTFAPAARRRHVRSAFDRTVGREWRRHEGEPWRVLRRVLRERFLEAHLAARRGVVLELGPGPGRFTPILAAGGRRSVLAIDLSRPVLESARRRLAREAARRSVEWLQGAGELLPLRDASVGSAVALGNIVSFAAHDGQLLLRELARVSRPGATLVADFATPVGAVQEFFHVAARRRFLPRILRDPRYFLVDRVLDTGFQPYAPARLTRWEFRFYTLEEARRSLARAGFRVIDAMSVAPVTRMDNAIAAVARRDPRTWDALLRTEEKVGRRPGVFESGDGFLVAATRIRR